MYSQNIPHVEILSEVSDSMVLLNKTDIDKINLTYFEKKKLVELNEINDMIIDSLTTKTHYLDSMIVIHKQMLNDSDIKYKNLQTQ